MVLRHIIPIKKALHAGKLSREQIKTEITHSIVISHVGHETSGTIGIINANKWPNINIFNHAGPSSVLI